MGRVGVLAVFAIGLILGWILGVITGVVVQKSAFIDDLLSAAAHSPTDIMEL